MQKDDSQNSGNMLSFAPNPIFSSAWDNRPSVPSPLSSSPIRASSPLSPVDRNSVAQRQSQSSPIQPPKFKFATRPTRPNPVVRRREEAQEKRRKNFLESVRQKSEDKKWQRRDIEGQFLKASYLEGLSQLAYDAPEVSEGDIEDAMTLPPQNPSWLDNDDAMMEEPPEEEDIEALVASYEERTAQNSPRPQSPPMSDDDYYDDIFAELIAQEQQQSLQNHAAPEEPMDTVFEDSTMSF